MIDAVIFFGLINICFEFVVLSMISPRIRLRVLGNRAAQTLLHTAIMVLMLTVHWGTLIGTMSGFFSFVLSIATVSIARKVYGSIVSGVYHVGFIKYTRGELT